MDQDYRSEAAWRAEMLAGQMKVRQSVSELGFLISGLFLAYLLSDFFPGAAIVVAAAMCVGAIYAVWRESQAISRMAGTPAPAGESASPVEEAATPGPAA
jgi:hypothetical protein